MLLEINICPNSTDWVALSAAAISLSTLIVIYFQLKYQRVALGTETLMKFEENFESEELSEYRKNAIKAIEEENLKYAENVFDFFETLGLLVKKKAIDKQLAWNSFCYWVIPYWQMGEEYIKQFRKDKKDKHYWGNFEFLFSVFAKIEKKNKNLKNIKSVYLSDTELEDFKKEESD